VASMDSNNHTMLKYKYRSDLAMNRMKESNERMDSAALFLIDGRRDKGLPLAARNRPLFESELQVQENNITEPGELEVTQRLRAFWTDYQQKFDRFQKMTDPEAAKQFYFAELEAAFEKVKNA